MCTVAAWPKMNNSRFEYPYQGMCPHFPTISLLKRSLFEEFHVEQQLNGTTPEMATTAMALHYDCHNTKCCGPKGPLAGAAQATRIHTHKYNGISDWVQCLNRCERSYT